jgi:hypothetical protein
VAGGIEKNHFCNNRAVSCPKGVDRKSSIRRPATETSAEETGIADLTLNLERGKPTEACPWFRIRSAGSRSKGQAVNENSETVEELLPSPTVVQEATRPKINQKVDPGSRLHRTMKRDTDTGSRLHSAAATSDVARGREGR